jgi:hypothetical protein
VRGVGWAVAAALCGGCFNPSAGGEDAGSTTGSEASTSGQPTGGTTTTATTTTTVSTCVGECGAETTSGTTTDEPTSGTTGGGPLFGKPTMYGIPWMSGMLVGQVLIDGYDDLILTSDVTADFAWLLGGESVDLQVKTAVPTMAVATYDFNADAVTDVVLASNEGIDSRLYSVTLGGPDPQLNEGVMMGCAASSLVVTDFGADGLPDVLTACPGVLQVDLYVGVGGSMLVKGTPTVIDVDPTAIGLADMVGGAEADLVVTSYSHETVRMVRGTGTAAFIVVETDVIGLTKPGVLRVGPLDTAPGDDVLALQADSLACAVIRGGVELAGVAKSECGTNLVDVALGDLDGDALMDAATVGTEGMIGGVLTVLRNGANGLESVETHALAGVPRRVVFADLDDLNGDDLAVLTDVGVEVLLRQP